MTDAERAERAVRKEVEGVLERLIVQVERDLSLIHISEPTRLM
jgi:hypothetical protein